MIRVVPDYRTWFLSQCSSCNVNVHQTGHILALTTLSGNFDRVFIANHPAINLLKSNVIRTDTVHIIHKEGDRRLVNKQSFADCLNCMQVIFRFSVISSESEGELDYNLLVTVRLINKFDCSRLA